MNNELNYSLKLIQEDAENIESLVCLRVTRQGDKQVPTATTHTPFATGSAQEDEISAHLWRIAEILTGKKFLDHRREWACLVGDRTLPCDVHVAPSTTLRAGVKLSTLMHCIELRRGGDPANDLSQVTGQAITPDAATGAHVSALPIEWKENEDDPTELCEESYGFEILFDGSEPPESRYAAWWGENLSESFETLEAAKAWCQQQADEWVRERAVVTTLATPRQWIGVDMGAPEGDRTVEIAVGAPAQATPA